MNSDSEGLAWSLYEIKSYAESIIVWETLIHEAPKDSEDYSRFLNGYVYSLVGLKRFDEARKIHHELFAKHGNHIDLHQLAFVEREAGNFQQALAYIYDERRLIGSEEWNYLAANSYELGKLNELLGRFDIALDFAKQCEEECKSSSDLVLKACSRRLLGDVYSRLEKPNTALSHYAVSEDFFEEARDAIGVAEIQSKIEALKQNYCLSNIFPVTHKDLQRISEIESACYHPELVTSLHGFHEFLKSQSENDFLLCAKKETSENIYGFICFSIQKPSPEVSTIWDLSVDPEFRSLGIGRCLLEKAIELVGEQTRSLSLHVPKANVSAVKLYEGLGFEKIKTLEGYYPGNEDGWVMVKS